MYLQEPTTPLLRPKIRKAKKTLDVDDAKVAEFLAFSPQVDLEPTEHTNLERSLTNHTAESAEARVIRWLEERGIHKSIPDEGKQNFYVARRNFVSETLEDLDSVRSWERSLGSEQSFNLCFSQSKIGVRRPNSFGLELESPVMVLKHSVSLQLQFGGQGADSQTHSQMEIRPRRHLLSISEKKTETRDL